MLKNALLSLVILLGAAACVGHPPGFSDGDLWEVPLVAPLEDDLLLVPVSINDKGPFLFMIDPDSEVSSVESSIQNSLDLYTGRSGEQQQTEEDHLVKVVFAEIKKMTIGTLSIRNMRVRVHPDGTYWSGGRRVHGILGRDAISDSLIYSFDRDRGKMYIGTQGHIKPPADAEKLSFTQSYSKHRRYLGKVTLNRKYNVTMHMDFGARTSLLWPKLIEKFKFPRIPVDAALVDEFGTKRTVTSGAIAGIVDAGKTMTNALLMLPYDDRRLEPEDLDGVLGQNFWSKYNVIVNWHQKKIYLQPRNPDLAATAQERIDRWGNNLRGCAEPACVTASIPELALHDDSPTEEVPPLEENVPADAATPGPEEEPAPGTLPNTVPGFAPDGETPVAPVESQAPGAQALSLLFEREAAGAEFAYDVVVAAVDAQGKTLDLPVFLVHFRSGIRSLAWSNLHPDYANAASFAVVDMNPIGTRGCDGPRCIYPLRAPR